MRHHDAPDQKAKTNLYLPPGPGKTPRDPSGLADLDGPANRSELLFRPAMRTARNVVTALALLVFLYGGIYWWSAREDILPFVYDGNPFDYSGDGGWKRRIFAPATELELRVSIDRRVRRALTGNWISSESGDFLTLLTADKCSFRLGDFEYSGKVEIERRNSQYETQFHHAGAPYTLVFTKGIVGPPLPDHLARAIIISDHKNEDHNFGEVLYRAELTRAPEPDR